MDDESVIYDVKSQFERVKCGYCDGKAVHRVMSANWRSILKIELIGSYLHARARDGPAGHTPIS